MVVHVVPSTLFTPVQRVVLEARCNGLDKEASGKHRDFSLFVFGNTKGLAQQ